MDSEKTCFFSGISSHVENHLLMLLLLVRQKLQKLELHLQAWPSFRELQKWGHLPSFWGHTTFWCMWLPSCSTLLGLGSHSSSQLHGRFFFRMFSWPFCTQCRKHCFNQNWLPRSSVWDWIHMSQFLTQTQFASIISEPINCWGSHAPRFPELWALHSAVSRTVSYTHLTLPTKRIV